VDGVGEGGVANVEVLQPREDVHCVDTPPTPLVIIDVVESLLCMVPLWFPVAPSVLIHPYALIDVTVYKSAGVVSNTPAQ
jgi:hypothetical protein